MIYMLRKSRETYMVALPKAAVEFLKWKKGSKLEIIFNRKGIWIEAK